MSLASRVAALASRIGLEVRTKIDATHPGVARAWVCFGYDGNQIVVRAAHNVAGVTRSAAGRYRVRFATPLPDANYCWAGLARSNTNSGTQRLLIVRATADEKTPTHVDVGCASAAGAFADSTEINLVVYR
ncbi:hypothetical protein [Ralstonia mannitolilytica]|uniref:Uncharacterized protein n=1 Tax=Ralstonia mannitolilytica TaxID=105219 RepID=A0AAJ4ZI03_9RALS|nr:hypothetical protein [Ralstonia mannitolilytica]CAG2153252.1 hypothetical protein LMG6866_04410 [Ralstonia mannitolilytica]SUD89591.1 Uncharacterised protein [Ralstonia mannitolilytica]SUD95971.1 Uncharacterised protein [Ralstonia mannitolilytica]